MLKIAKCMQVVRFREATCKVGMHSSQLVAKSLLLAAVSRLPVVRAVKLTRHQDAVVTTLV